MKTFEGNQLNGLVDRMRAAFVGRDEIVQEGTDVGRTTDFIYDVANGVNAGLVSFNVVRKDTGGFFNPAVPTRLTPKKSGWYVVSGGIAATWNTPPTPGGIEMTLQIRDSGFGPWTYTSQQTVANKITYLNVQRAMWLDYPKYVELYATIGFITPALVKFFGGFLYSCTFSMTRYS